MDNNSKESLENDRSEDMTNSKEVSKNLMPFTVYLSSELKSKKKQ